jgi:hypothetical protein
MWSESRYELCKALSYYRSYKGGGYHSQGIARAFMYDNLAMRMIRSIHSSLLVPEAV